MRAGARPPSDIAKFVSAAGPQDNLGGEHSNGICMGDREFALTISTTVAAAAGIFPRPAMARTLLNVPRERTRQTRSNAPESAHVPTLTNRRLPQTNYGSLNGSNELPLSAESRRGTRV